MLKKTPDFEGRSELFLHIRSIYYQSNGRAKYPAFMEDEGNKRDGLSVNSGEVETVNQVATIYAYKSGEQRPVAISTHSIAEYNSAADQVGTKVSYDPVKKMWSFAVDSEREAAYLHDPKIGNRSHCLAKFTRYFDDRAAQKFAMKMAYKPRYTKV